MDAGGVPARLYRPSTQEALGLLIYFHGGGWVLGSVGTHDHVTRALAAESGCAVLSVDYRLAPEHPFPAASTTRCAASAGRTPTRGRLGSDPAPPGDRRRLRRRQPRRGGAHAARRPPAPAFQLLVYPVTDARRGTASSSEFADGFFLTTAPACDWFLEHYLPSGAAPRRPAGLTAARDDGPSRRRPRRS